jgi:hypothetical protein
MRVCRNWCGLHFTDGLFDRELQNRIRQTAKTSAIDRIDENVFDTVGVRLTDSQRESLERGKSVKVVDEGGCLHEWLLVSVELGVNGNRG